jgi:nucleotide-binding universal stress UspA family protein
MTILATTDFSDASKRAVRIASNEARRRSEDLLVLHCLESAVDDTPWRHLSEVPRNPAANFWQKARDQLKRVYEDTVPPDERPHDIEYRVIAEYADDGIRNVLQEGGIDLVVVGATGSGRVANFFLGSTAEDVARISPVPVLVVPDDGPQGPFEHIVAPVDFTDCSTHSLRHAIDLARRDGARLTIVHGYLLPVSDTTFLPSQIPPDTIQEFEQQRQKKLADFVDGFDLQGIDWETKLDVGSPHNVIVDTADQKDADLVVMGTHGRRGMRRFFLGSNAVKVLRRMPCSVMTVRTPDTDESSV